MDFGRRAAFFLVLVVASPGWTAEAQEFRRFGERIALGTEASLTVTRRDAGEFRANYASEFPPTIQNLVAFEFRSEGDGTATYTYWTDRTNPSGSDVVVLCDSERVNILKMGGGTFSDPKAYRFGSPGAIEIKGRWGVVGAFGSVPTLFFFSLPAACAPEQIRLSITLEVSQGEKKASHQLILSAR